jgi:hypothetical protein
MNASTQQQQFGRADIGRRCPDYATFWKELTSLREATPAAAAPESCSEDRDNTVAGVLGDSPTSKQQDHRHDIPLLRSEIEQLRAATVKCERAKEDSATAASSLSSTQLELQLARPQLDETVTIVINKTETLERHLQSVQQRWFRLDWEHMELLTEAQREKDAARLAIERSEVSSKTWSLSPGVYSAARHHAEIHSSIGFVITVDLDIMTTPAHVPQNQHLTRKMQEPRHQVQQGATVVSPWHGWQ